MIMWQSVVWCAALLVFVFGKDSHHKKTRGWSNIDEGQLLGIVGGYPSVYRTTIENYPYQVSLHKYNGGQNDIKYVCGGSIISQMYILTAAHCLKGIPNLLVRAGSSRTDSGGILISAKRFHFHQDYNSIPKDYDVGFIELSSPLSLDGITMNVVQLAPSNMMLEEHTLLDVTGWGHTEENGVSSEILRATTVPVISSQKCQNFYRFYYKITPQMMCAGVIRGGQNTCQGDSGGPVVVNDRGTPVQVGIVSFAIGCGRPHFPGVYVSVAAVRSWIEFMTGI